MIRMHFACTFFLLVLHQNIFLGVLKSVLQLEFQNVVSFARSSLRNVHHA